MPAVSNKESGRPALVAFSLLLAGVIFVIDTVTPLEIAIAVFYTVIVLLSVSYAQRRGVILISVACMVLTGISYFLSFRGTMQSGLVNMGISLSAIAATTYLALKIESARQSMQEAREHLAHASRVTALGELSASIAHEVNQPLAAIITSGNACKRWLSNDQAPRLDKANMAVDRMINDAQRASDIIVHVRDLARKRTPHRENVDMTRLVTETLALTRTELSRHNISLLLDCRESRRYVKGDRIQLQQTLLNLILNAIEAMSQSAGAPKRELQVSTYLDQSHVHIRIADTGPGIPAAQKTGIFEAFRTSKPNGLGMGLAIVSSVVESHGGAIMVSDNQPQGAVFDIQLPLSEGQER